MGYGIPLFGFPYPHLLILKRLAHAKRFVLTAMEIIACKYVFRIPPIMTILFYALIRIME